MMSMTNDTKFPVQPDGRWHIPVSDDGYWRMGVYRPEHRSPDDITRLEKHSCPELFICQGGRAGLVIGSGERERVIELSPGEAVHVTEHHNGFLIDPVAYFFVVERTSFTTEYIDRTTLAVVERRSVG